MLIGKDNENPIDKIMHIVPKKDHAEFKATSSICLWLFPDLG